MRQHPLSLFQCWKMAKCTHVSVLKCCVNIVQGWGGAKCMKNKFSTTMMRLKKIIKKTMTRLVGSTTIQETRPLC